jgi:AAA domain
MLSEAKAIAQTIDDIRTGCAHGLLLLSPRERELYGDEATIHAAARIQSMHARGIGYFDPEMQARNGVLDYVDAKLGRPLRRISQGSDRGAGSYSNSTGIERLVVPGAPIWKPSPWQWQDPKTVERLQCLYSGHFWRGEIVATISPGGVGKSVHSIVEALAMITGKPLLGEPSRGGLKVLLMNFEDSKLVLRHRVTAAILYYKLDPREVLGRLYVESVDSDLMCFAENGRGEVRILKPAVHALTEAISANGIDVVIVDPWVSIHRVDGNLSHLVQPIVTAFKGIAMGTSACIEIVAHSRKPNGRELTEDDALGSVAFVNKMRDIRVLNKMTETEASNYGLAPWAAGDYFRVDTPKHTHRRSVKPAWRQKVSQSLGNGGPGAFDFATEVGVVAQWSPPTPQSLIDGIELEQIEAIKVTVKSGLDRENVQAANWAGKAIAKVLGLDVVDRGEKAKVKITLRALIDAGHFDVEERPNPSCHGRTCKHLVPADPDAEEIE